MQTNQFGVLNFEGLDPSQFPSSTSSTSQPFGQEPQSSPAMETDDYYSTMFQTSDHDYSKNSLFELKAIELEPRLTYPAFFWYGVKLCKNMDILREMCGTILTAFPKNTPIMFTEEHLTELRGLPPSEIRHALTQKHEVPTPVLDSVAFKLVLQYPEVTISPAGDHYLLTHGDSRAIFSPHLGCFLSGREVISSFLSVKKGKKVEVDSPSYNLMCSMHHLFSVYQVKTDRNGPTVGFTFIRKSHPMNPPIHPLLNRARGGALVDDYANVIQNLLNKALLASIPTGMASDPDIAVIQTLFARYGSYSKIPVMLREDRKPVEFSLLETEYTNRWMKLMASVNIVDPALAMVFISTHASHANGCVEYLQKSRTFRNTHQSMNELTHRSMDAIHGTEPLPDHYNALLKYLNLMEQFKSINPKYDSVVVCGADEALLKVLEKEKVQVFVIDTSTPTWIPSNAKMVNVESLYGVNADYLAKLGVTDNSLFILAKGSYVETKKESAFQQNLDLYAWFFKLPWKNAVTKIYYPGLDIPAVLKPAFARCGWRFAQDAGRMHNDECFMLFHGAPNTERNTAGNYRFGTIRLGFIMRMTNELRNEMIFNGIPVLKRDMIGREKLLQDMLDLARPLRPITFVEPDLDISFDFQPLGTGGEKRSAPDEEEPPAPDFTPMHENASYVAPPTSANSNGTLVPVPLEMDEDTDRERGQLKPREKKQKSGQSRGGRGRGRGGGY